MSPTSPAAGGAEEGATSPLLPFLGELLDGLSALEPLSAPLLDLLAEAGLAHGARLLDPACGRGGPALSLAARFGCQVDGVDESAALIGLAEAEGLRRSLPCRFRTGAPSEALAMAAGNPRDLVLWLGQGRDLGPPEVAVGLLRRAVRTGGLLLLEDGFLREGAEPLPGQEGYRPRMETLAALCAHGDLVVGEQVSPDDEVRAANRRDLASLRARAAALAARQPALQAALTSWLEAQATQVLDLEQTLQSATWVLRRGET